MTCGRFFIIGACALALGACSSDKPAVSADSSRATTTAAETTVQTTVATSPSSEPATDATDAPATTDAPCPEGQHPVDRDGATVCVDSVIPTDLLTSPTTAPPTTEGPTTTRPKAKSGHHTLSIDFTLFDNDGVADQGASCSGKGGYSDFAPGLNVVVHDGDGKVIGAGSLDDSLAVSVFECRLRGTVDVKDAEFYVVTIGSRGDQTYTKADMEANGYSLELSLGHL